MRLFGLIGYPLGHSFSQKYFSEKFARENITDARYELFPVESIAELPALLKRNPDLRGLNVTIPHKETVIPFLDALDETASAVGAVNCIKIENQQLKGFNTDVTGFEKSLKTVDGGRRTADGGRWTVDGGRWTVDGRRWTADGGRWTVDGRRWTVDGGRWTVDGRRWTADGGRRTVDDKEWGEALILGTGGAAKAVAYILKKLGTPYRFVSRHPAGENQISYETLHLLPSTLYRLIVNTTPLGMAPHTNTCPDLPFERLTPQHFVYDLVYNPAETLLLQRARAQGCTVKNGLEMLHLQAEAAWEIWNN